MLGLACTFPARRKAKDEDTWKQQTRQQIGINEDTWQLQIGIDGRLKDE